MLKRSRAPSPSPTRPDPLTPALDNNPLLPLPKRRRTVGPIIDSSERRDDGVMDDGEDDYEDEDEDDEGSTNISTSYDKVYEHMNHLLHDLHAEHQHRSHATLPRSSLMHPHQQQYRTPAFLLPRDPTPALSSPLSSPAKYDRDHKTRKSSVLNNERAESQDADDELSDGHDHADDDDAPHKVGKAGVQSDERIRVMHRYEDTNRLLGSLVLSRRRTLGSSSVDPE